MSKPVSNVQIASDGNGRKPYKQLFNEDKRGFYIQLLVEYPVLILLFFFTISVVLSISAVLQPTTLDYGISAFELRDHVSSMEWDARSEAIRAGNKNLDLLIDEIKTSGNTKRSEGQYSINSPQFSRIGKFHVVVSFPSQVDAQGKSTPSNVFEPQNLEAIHDIYNRVMNYSGYQDYCWWDYTNFQCFAPESLMPFFFKKSPFDNETIIDLSGTGQYLTKDINKALGLVMRNNLWQFTDTTFSVSNPRSSLLRFVFLWGSPLKGYNGPFDRKDEQVAKTKRWLTGLVSMMKDIQKEKQSNMTVYYGGDWVTEMEIMDTIYSDALYAIGSFTLVFFFMMIHTESVFLSITALIQILLSFPTVYFIYRVVFGITWIGVLNFIGLFIIMGIGVDDVFVFYDVFAQTSHLSDLKMRLRIVYGRAMKATFITTVTTAVAFVSNIASPIPALRVFGIFMFMIVVMNYIMVVTMFPPVLAIWEKHIKNRCSKTCLCTSRIRSKIMEKLGFSDRAVGGRPIDQFFKNGLAPFLRKARWVVTGVFFLLFVGSIVLSTRLSPSNKPPAFFPAENNVQRFLDWQQSGSLAGSALAAGTTTVAGCDGIINSGKIFDICGVCGGDGSTCSPPVPPPVFIRVPVAPPPVASPISPPPVTPPVEAPVEPPADLMPPVDAPVEDPPSFAPVQHSPVASPSASPVSPPTEAPIYVAPPVESPIEAPVQSPEESQSPPADVSPSSASPVAQQAPYTESPVSFSPIEAPNGIAPTSAPTESATAPVQASAPSGTGSPQSFSAPYDANAPLNSAPVNFRSNPPAESSPVQAPVQPAPAPVEAPITLAAPLEAPVEPPTAPPPTAPPVSQPILAPISSPSNAPSLVLAPFSLRTPPPSTPPTQPPQDPPIDQEAYLCSLQGKILDICGVCGGDGKSCLGCDGVAWSFKKEDFCGVCGGNNTCLASAQVTISNYYPVYFVWGIQTLDRSSVDVNNPFSDFKGNVVYDSKFDPTSEAAQMFLLSVCDRTNQRSDLVVPGSVNCFMSRFQSHCLNTARINRFPLPKSIFGKELLNWLLYNSNGTVFRGHVGFKNLTQADADLTKPQQQPQITYMQVEFRSRVHPSMSAAQQIEKWNEWEAWTNQLNSEAPVGMQEMYQTTWQWSRAFMETSLISGLVAGLVLSAAVALCALLIMVGNIVTSLIATIIIVLNVVLVLALFWLMNWNLGVIEAISVTVLVGLSDEYVFHLADAYTEVQEEDASALESKRPIAERRFHLMREAMYRVGASVLSGASTTAIASAMLILTAIRIFFRFGIVVSINIAIAVTLSLILFPSLMMLWGPVGRFGNTHWLAKTGFWKALACCFGKKKGSKKKAADSPRNAKSRASTSSTEDTTYEMSAIDTSSEEAAI